MGNAERCRDAARIVDILPGAAGALAVRRLAMVVKLQGDADHVIALAGKQAGNDRGIHAPGHRDNNARVFGTLGDIKRIQHSFSSGWVQGPAEIWRGFYALGAAAATMPQGSFCHATGTSCRYAPISGKFFHRTDQANR